MPDEPPNVTTDASKPRFIDTHIHLDADQFAGDLDEVIGAAIGAGVDRFINIGYEPARWESTVQLTRRHPRIRPVFGMHPGSSHQWSDGAAAQLTTLVRDCRPVAIGEIGMDLFRYETNLAMQRAVFSAQLDLAVEHGLPVVIHMRAAEPDVLEVLRARSALPPLLFHSFEGSPALTSFVNESGSMVGVGGLATRSKSVTIRDELGRIELSRMVLETDAPYLVPAKRRGSRNVPANLPAVATMLADLKLTDVHTIANVTTANAVRFFNLERDVSP